MDFQEYLKEAASQIEEESARFLQAWKREVEKVSPTLVPLTVTFIENCSGGKRLRGTLVKLGYEIATNEFHLGGVMALQAQPATVRGDLKDIIKVGCAVEIFQTSILAHDDIIDQSPIRRGKPTIYRQLGGNHYGISQTIALADIGFFLAVRLISEANFPAEHKNKAISAFSQTVINTGLGEVLDVEVPHKDAKKREEDVLTIHRLKTSYYTIIDPLQLGVILAGGDEKLLEQIEQFGQNLGLAFQIQDDILGVFGDEKALGKSVTSDIEEGKNTLLITQAAKLATTAQKQVLDRYYGKGKIGQTELEQVRSVFRKTGALDYSRQEAVKYVNLAKKVIPKLTSDLKYQKLLTEMADFLVERDK